jgi:hypothetical protein
MGEVDALTEDVQFWAATERKKRGRRERRIIFTGGWWGWTSLFSPTYRRGVVDQDICKDRHHEKIGRSAFVQ